MRAAPRVGVLVQRRPVEAGERPVVAGEVRGDPVEDQADPVAVQAVDEVAEVVGAPEHRERRVVARDLVAPRAGEGMLRDGEQLDVREPEVLDVGRELVRELAPAEPLPPRLRVHLVDRQRPVQRLLRAPRGDPVVVAPGERAPADDGSRLGRNLGLERVRVGLQPQVARRCAQLELVLRAGLDARYEELPDPR
jgi:hypothetical protein